MVTAEGDTVQLCCGQRWMWNRLRLPDGIGQLQNLRRNWRLPPNSDAAWIEAVITELARRHESLRTKYVWSTSQSEPMQVVMETVDIRLQIHDAETRDRPSPEIERVVQEFVDVQFVPTQEICWRALLLYDDKSPVRIVMVFHHLTVDFQGLLELEREFYALMSGEAGFGSDVDSQPRTLARREHERSMSETLQYWMGAFIRSGERTAGLSDIFTIPSRPASATLLETSLSRETALQGARAIGVLPMVLVLGAYLMHLSALTGLVSCPLYIMASNRFDRPYRHVVSTLAQPVLIVPELAPEQTVASFLRTLQAETMSTVRRHGVYDTDAVAALEARYGTAASNSASGLWFNGAVTPSHTIDYAKPTMRLRKEQFAPAEPRNPGAYAGLDCVLGRFLDLTLYTDDIVLGLEGRQRMLVGMRTVLTQMMALPGLNVGEVVRSVA